MVITNQILQRTFKLKSSDSVGTCFTIDVEGRQYLVTARHLVDSLTSAGTLQIWHDKMWKNVEVTLVGHGTGHIDISVLAPNITISGNYPLELEGSCRLAQDVYFLGFPYEMGSEVGSMNRDFPIPMVKKGIISGFHKEAGANVLYLDGHNNPGFSGGPVVCEEVSVQEETTSVIGVVSGYRYDAVPIYLDKDKTTLTYHANTGIVIAIGIKHALDLIEENSAGRKTASEET